MSTALDMAHLAERQAKSTQHELARAAVTAQLSTTYAILELAAAVQRVGVRAIDELSDVHGTLVSLLPDNVDNTDHDGQPAPLCRSLHPSTNQACVLLSLHKSAHTTYDNYQWED